MNQQQIECVRDERDQTLIEQSQDLLTNLQYQIEHNIYIKYPCKTHKKLQITQKSEKIILLGQLYKQEINESQEQAYERINKIYQQIIWFSYRKNFPILKPKHLNLTNYISDTGWGCMIRVGQMMFGQILRLLDDEKFINNFKKERKNYELIDLFQDCQLEFKESPFSIQQICKVANEEFMMYPGDWYKGTTITMVIEKLYLRYCELMEVQEQIGFSIFTDGCIFVKDILKQQLENNSKCKQPSSQCESKCIDNLVNINKQDLQNYLNQICNQCTNWSKQLYLLICIKIGIDSPQPKYFENVKYLLNSKYSVGILGGKPRRALYFVGYQKNQLILLDPHYVQNSYEKINCQSQYNEFFKSNMTGIDINKIDTSLAFGFYIQNYQQFLEFYDYLIQGEKESLDWIIGLQPYLQDISYVQQQFPCENLNNSSDIDDLQFSKQQSQFINETDDDNEFQLIVKKN